MASKVYKSQSAQCRILQRLQENLNLKSKIVLLIVMRLSSNDF